MAPPEKPVSWTAPAATTTPSEPTLPEKTSQPMPDHFTKVGTTDLPGAASFSRLGEKKKKPKAAPVQEPESQSVLPPPSELPALGGLPSIGGGRRAFGGLGGVGNRYGGFDVDPAALKRANADLAKLNKIHEPDFGDEEEKKEEPDNRSMMQVMQDKARAAEEKNAALRAAQP